MATFTTAGGKVLELRPFVIATTEEVLPKITALSGLEFAAQVTSTVEILVEALRRNNEGITAAWCKENILSQELNSLLAAVLGVSGLKRAAPGEAKSP